MALSTTLAIGCGDGSGSSGSGGTGGSGGSGGSGGATTSSSNSLIACPLQADPHVTATVVAKDGSVLGDMPLEVSGPIQALGIDSPPTPACGSGEAWVTIANDGDGALWTACFIAPNLVLDATVGQPATLTQAVDAHGVAPASVHTTLRVNDALVLHVEQATYEAEIALPEGITIARAGAVCASPSSPCQIEGYDTTVTADGETVGVAAGESGDAGGYRVYVDHYWTAKASSECDGGDADVRISVTPSPGI